MRPVRFWFLLLAPLLLLGACVGKTTQVPVEVQPPPTCGPMVRPEEPASVERRPPLRILALGDSITQGRGPKGGSEPATQSWRYPFWRELVVRGVDFDMVGGFSHGFESDPEWPAVNGVPFDRDHESHWGFRLDEMTEILRKDLDRLRFDVVLVLLGGNDLGQNQPLSGMWTKWETLLGMLRAKNPHVMIAVGLYCHTWGVAGEYRAELRARAPSWSTEESRVVLADGCERWVADPKEPGTDTVDYVHPNAQGDEKIARGFLRSLEQLTPEATASKFQSSSSSSAIADEAVTLTK